MIERVPRPSRLWDDRGSATAETAIVLPVVVAMVLVILVVGAGIGTQVRLESAARGAARELARGEDHTAATGTAQRIAGDDVQVMIGGDGTWVLVTTTRTLQVDSGPLSGASWELSADATARREPHLTGEGQP